MGLREQLRGAVGAAMTATDGLASNCVWSRVTGTSYDPVAGANVETVVSQAFRAIKGVYKIHERVNGIEAGDVPLYVDANLITRPHKGEVIAVDSVAHEIQNVEDVSGVLYVIQLRRK